MTFRTGGDTFGHPVVLVTVLEVFKAKMLFYQSKANLVEKILFDNITHLIDLEIRKILEMSLCGEPIFNIPFWSMIYLPFKLKFISGSDNCTEFEFQCQIYHGPEWKVEFSIPILILRF